MKRPLYRANSPSFALSRLGLKLAFRDVVLSGFELALEPRVQLFLVTTRSNCKYGPSGSGGVIKCNS
jgi:hypothetical protein